MGPGCGVPHAYSAFTCVPAHTPFGGGELLLRPLLELLNCLNLVFLPKVILTTFMEDCSHPNPLGNGNKISAQRGMCVWLQKALLK